MPRKYNKRLTEWEEKVSAGLDGGDSGVWASCTWNAETHSRYLDLRYFTAKGKPTGHYILADPEQVRTLKRIIERFEAHDEANPKDPKAT